MGACICLFCIQAYHSLEENRQRNNHVEVYRYTVKCASEDMVSPRSTLRSLIYTPRGSHPCNVLVLNSIVVVSKRPKTKRDNAFQYVVPPPQGSTHLSVHPSQYGQIAIAKIQNLFQIITLSNKKLRKKHFSAMY